VEGALPNIKWLAVIVLSVALSGTAYSAGRGGGGHGGGGHGGGGHGGGGHAGGAHFGGGHFGGGRGGGFRAARFAGGGRHFGGRAAGGSSFRGARSVAAPNAAGNLSRQNAVRASAIHHALAAHAVAGALHNHGALHNPAARAHIAAVAATAGLQGRDRRGGWWRHSNGGYGWVGPLFWPFAYYDLYDYAMWGNDPSLWDYGYGDIYAGIFTPYGYDDLTGYLPSSGSATPASAGSSPAPNAPGELAQMCGDDSREIAGLPIDRIQQALAPNDEQRQALDDLANASVQAAQTIKAACPTQVASTAPGRLAAMQSRIEAMIAAVRLVEPPLDHFYGLLNDEQKARLTALGQDQRRGSGGVLAQSDCGKGQAGVTDWPAAELEQRLHPTDAQRVSLISLKDASAKAAEILKGTCEPNQTLTPPARLSAAGKRLDAMLQAVETVKASLDDLYGELSDEQKAQFESLGPGRKATAVSAPADTAASEQAALPSRHTHRRHHASIIGLVRRLIGF
jgi:LTXXQ motif family protein